jgi:hypothetical protein
MADKGQMFFSMGLHWANQNGIVQNMSFGKLQFY